MRFIYQKWFSLFVMVQIGFGENVMVGKKGIQSSDFGTWWEPHDHYHYLHEAKLAVDGDTSTVTRTENDSLPYWQGDLQGYYFLRNISVIADSGAWADDLRNATVRVGINSVVNNTEEATTCGQLPEVVQPGETYNFSCDYLGPVRFVEISRDDGGYLSIAEVVVDGIPMSTTSTKYRTTKKTKLKEPLISTNATSASECGRLCFLTQPCISFSFTSASEPNCLLGPTQKTESDNKWENFAITRSLFDSSCATSKQ